MGLFASEMEHEVARAVRRNMLENGMCVAAGSNIILTAFWR